MRIRIKFRKYGVMRFIGHLDIMRYFQKAMRRANIDIAYSEGFSPHQIMSFKPRATPFTFKDAFAVDMKPWRNVKIASIGILFAMIGVYAGLAEFGGYGTRWLAMISYFIAAVVIVYLIFDSWRHRHDPAVTFTPDGKDSL